jgi:hypothetical protein
MAARSLTLVLFAAAALVCAAGQAQGAETAAATITRVVELNREAVALYEKAELEAARATLHRALELCAAAGLDRHPVAARTHVHLGILLVGGFGQKDVGREQFAAALSIAPEIDLTPGLASPEVQLVFDEARATGAAPPRAPDDDERPKPIPNTRTEDIFQIEKRHARRAGAAKEGATRDDDDDDDDDGPATRWRFAALVGAGTGWTSGYADVNADTAVPGSFATTRLDHVTAEVGTWVTREWMLSLRGRFQWVSGPTSVEAQGRTYAPATAAIAGFAAATWSPDTGRLRPYLSLAAGAGRIRHVVTLSSLDDCGASHNQVCVDTVRSGPFFAAASGGVSIDVGGPVALVVGVTAGLATGGAPFNLDLDAGLALRL